MDVLLWATVSSVGSPGVLFLLSVVFFAIAEEMERHVTPRKRERWRKASKLILLSVMISMVLSLTLKAVVMHPRPCAPCLWPYSADCNPYCLADYSFPSGHAAVAFAAAAAAYASIGRKKYAVLFVLPALVGLSRIFLGVHTVWDVLGGAALGLVSADVAELILDYKRRGKAIKQRHRR